MNNNRSFDALLPPAMAQKAENAGVAKANLLPVNMGNIIGGAVMVGLMYWFIYLRPQREWGPRIITTPNGRLPHPTLLLQYSIHPQTKFYHPCTADKLVARHTFDFSQPS